MFALTDAHDKNLKCSKCERKTSEPQAHSQEGVEREQSSLSHLSERSERILP